MGRQRRDAYGEMAPPRVSDLPHASQGHSPEELLGEAHQRHASQDALEGLTHAAR